jgi:hypothetical protein
MKCQKKTLSKLEAHLFSIWLLNLIEKARIYVKLQISTFSNDSHLRWRGCVCYTSFWKCTKQRLSQVMFVWRRLDNVFFWHFISYCYLLCKKLLCLFIFVCLFFCLYLFFIIIFEYSLIMEFINLLLLFAVMK